MEKWLVTDSLGHLFTVASPVLILSWPSQIKSLDLAHRYQNRRRPTFSWILFQMGGGGFKTLFSFKY